MEYLSKIIISLVFLLGGTYLFLYFCRPFLARHLAKNHQMIEVITHQFIPKIGHVSVLAVDGLKYLVISSSSGVAVTVMEKTRTMEAISDELQK